MEADSSTGVQTTVPPTEESMKGAKPKTKVSKTPAQTQAKPKQVQVANVTSSSDPQKSKKQMKKEKKEKKPKVQVKQEPKEEEDEEEEEEEGDEEVEYEEPTSTTVKGTVETWKIKMDDTAFGFIPEAMMTGGARKALDVIRAPLQVVARWDEYWGTDFSRNILKPVELGDAGDTHPMIAFACWISGKGYKTYFGKNTTPGKNRNVEVTVGDVVIPIFDTRRLNSKGEAIGNNITTIDDCSHAAACLMSKLVKPVYEKFKTYALTGSARTSITDNGIKKLKEISKGAFETELDVVHALNWSAVQKPHQMWNQVPGGVNRMDPHLAVALMMRSCMIKGTKVTGDTKKICARNIGKIVTVSNVDLDEVRIKDYFNCLNNKGQGIPGGTADDVGRLMDVLKGTVAPKGGQAATVNGK